MGLPALRHESRADSRRPHLRLVKPEASKPERKHVERAVNASVFQSFVFFAVIVCLVCVLGLGRIWLSVQATQASLDSVRLRRDIKLEQYQGDMLEVQQSALATPSRIKAIAGGTLGMVSATSVSYLDLRAERVPDAMGKVALAERSPTGLSRVFAGAMEVAAGEARVLLVGDVGLSSSR